MARPIPGMRLNANQYFRCSFSISVEILSYGAHIQDRPEGRQGCHIERSDGSFVAERVGFEPTVPLPGHAISSRAYSATLAPLQRNQGPTARGGEGGIRTHDEIAPILVFETSAFNRSATSPRPEIIAQAWIVPVGARRGHDERRRFLADDP